MRFVLDNSVLVAWLLDESAQYADAVGARLAADQAAAPSIWPLEFANVLAVAERRGRLDAAEVVRVRDLVRALPIRVVPDPPTRVLTDVLALGAVTPFGGVGFLVGWGALAFAVAHAYRR